MTSIGSIVVAEGKRREAWTFLTLTTLIAIWVAVAFAVDGSPDRAFAMAFVIGPTAWVVFSAWLAGRERAARTDDIVASLSVPFWHWVAVRAAVTAALAIIQVAMFALAIPGLSWRAPPIMDRGFHFAIGGIGLAVASAAMGWLVGLTSGRRAQSGMAAAIGVVAAWHVLPAAAAAARGTAYDWLASHAALLSPVHLVQGALAGTMHPLAAVAGTSGPVLILGTIAFGQNARGWLPRRGWIAGMAAIAVALGILLAAIAATSVPSETPRPGAAFRFTFPNDAVYQTVGIHGGSLVVAADMRGTPNATLNNIEWSSSAKETHVRFVEGTPSSVTFDAAGHARVELHIDVVPFRVAIPVDFVRIVGTTPEHIFGGTFTLRLTGFEPSGPLLAALGTSLAVGIGLCVNIVIVRRWRAWPG